MISSLFKKIGLIDGGASDQQRAFMQDIQAISLDHKGDEDEYTVRVNGNVDMTFARKLPTFYRAASNEVFLTDIRSLYQGQGNVKQALSDMKQLILKHKVDVTVEIGQMAYESDDDFIRLGQIFYKAGFKQNQAHHELFMLEYADLRKSQPKTELKPV